MFNRGRRRLQKIRQNIGSNSTSLSHSTNTTSTDDNTDKIPSPHDSPSNGKIGSNLLWSGSTRRFGTSELAAFDACVEACDALAATSTTFRQKRGSNDDFQLSDCFVRVSPDGELMFVPVPSSSPRKEKLGEEDTFKKSEGIKLNDSTVEDRSIDDVTKEQDKQAENCPVLRTDGHAPKINSKPGKIEFDEGKNEAMVAALSHISDDEINNLVVVGDDRPGGEFAANGFSANGWSPDAASVIFRESWKALALTSEFVEQVILARKESAANTANACDHIRYSISTQTESKTQTQKSRLWNEQAPSTTASKRRQRGNGNGILLGGRFMASNNDSAKMKSDNDYVGSSQPGLGFKSYLPSLHAAISALEVYHNVTAEGDSERMRLASQLPKIQSATKKTGSRVIRREAALQNASRQAEEAEKRLEKCKVESRRRWGAVEEAEKLAARKIKDVTQEMMRQRALSREQQRSIQQQELQKSDSGNSKHQTQPSQEEIWELVSQVTESFEQGSFAPTGMPLPQMDNTNNEAEEEPIFVSLTETEQAQIEQQMNLPTLRADAKAADEAVTDAVGALLNALSCIDTTHRSARIAVEAGMLSAANAQANCVRSMFEMEKESLKERLRLLEDLEEKVNKIDVKSDLGKLMNEEKKKPGSRAEGGDEDDGGIASALAVLNCHHEMVGGVTGLSNQMGTVVLEGWGAQDETGLTSRDEIDEMIQYLFNDSPSQLDEERKKAEATAHSGNSSMPNDLESTVEFLVKAVTGHSQMSRIHRAMVCYALNKQRSKGTEIKDDNKFDGLCNVLEALLSGCDREMADISNAKICMMLAQTFFKINRTDEIGMHYSESDEFLSRDGRCYIKTKLSYHPLWKDEHFWDQALFQCISEALTKSGVLQGFEGSYPKRGSAIRDPLEWHDLNHLQRIEAASQVHNVVAAQLGALAHSMVEFGCGIERACSFVRRMSIRHQLPISQRAILLRHLVDSKCKNSVKSVEPAESTSNDLRRKDILSLCDSSPKNANDFMITGSRDGELSKNSDTNSITSDEGGSFSQGSNINVDVIIGSGDDSSSYVDNEI